MNISQKCNCCIKESVCKYKTEYQCDCEKLKQFIQSSPIEISIKCKEFVAHQTNIREVQDER
jgi:hypothetical protein